MEALQLYELLEAAKLKQCMEDITRLLKENPWLINQIDEHGFTVLQWSVLKRNIEIVELLLENGADVDLPDKFGSTALMQATSQNLQSLCHMLVNYGANIGARTNCDMSVIHIACQTGSIEVVEFLLSHGANLHSHCGAAKQNCLHIATTNGHKELVKFLLILGLSCSQPDKVGRLPLFYAIQHGQYFIAWILLLRGIYDMMPKGSQFHKKSSYTFRDILFLAYSAIRYIWMHGQLSLLLSATLQYLCDLFFPLVFIAIFFLTILSMMPPMPSFVQKYFDQYLR